MRTTIYIDDDVLLAAKEIACRERTSAGAIISNLARVGLTGGPAADRVAESDSFHGFHSWPSRGRPVTNELIARLREDGPS